MKIEALHIGMKVRHPQYGVGQVKSVSEHTAEIRFGEVQRAIERQAAGLEPDDAQASLNGLNVPLGEFIERTVAATVSELGLESPDSQVDKLGARWHGGKAVLHPSDPTLQTKEVPLEVFFHKVV